MTPAVILLHPNDNVVVCSRAVLAGEHIVIEGAVDFIAAQNVDVGHKIARVALLSGAKVIKHGSPIGSMTAAVAVGGWVHLHNMRSDYISVHPRAATGDEHDKIVWNDFGRREPARRARHRDGASQYHWFPAQRRPPRNQ
jgi:(2R)-sulfolactate sulfo-lyase subunit alpha